MSHNTSDPFNLFMDEIIKDALVNNLNLTPVELHEKSTKLWKAMSDKDKYVYYRMSAVRSWHSELQKSSKTDRPEVTSTIEHRRSGLETRRVPTRKIQFQKKTIDEINKICGPQVERSTTYNFSNKVVPKNSTLNKNVETTNEEKVWGSSSKKLDQHQNKLRRFDTEIKENITDNLEKDLTPSHVTKKLRRPHVDLRIKENSADNLKENLSPSFDIPLPHLRSTNLYEEEVHAIGNPKRMLKCQMKLNAKGKNSEENVNKHRFVEKPKTEFEESLISGYASESDKNNSFKYPQPLTLLDKNKSSLDNSASTSDAGFKGKKFSPSLLTTPLPRIKQSKSSESSAESFNISPRLKERLRAKSLKRRQLESKRPITSPDMDNSQEVVTERKDNQENQECEVERPRLEPSVHTLQSDYKLETEFQALNLNKPEMQKAQLKAPRHVQKPQSEVRPLPRPLFGHFPQPFPVIPHRMVGPHNPFSYPPTVPYQRGYYGNNIPLGLQMTDFYNGGYAMWYPHPGSLNLRMPPPQTYKKLPQNQIPKRW